MEGELYLNKYLKKNLFLVYLYDVDALMPLCLDALMFVLF